MNEIIIDLIRHGEPQGGKRFRGHSIDDVLSDNGWQQMRNATAGHSHWDKIITSPMQRCAAFSHELSQQLKIPVEVETDFKEVGFGIWEGKTRNELKQHRADEYKAFYQDPINNRPEGAEPFDEFITRVARVYDRLIKSCDGQHVLIVAHAGVIRAVLTHALQEDPVAMYQTKIENAKFSRLRHQSQQVIAEFINASL